jgi:hypothetical protein
MSTSLCPCAVLPLSLALVSCHESGKVSLAFFASHTPSHSSSPPHPPSFHQHSLQHSLPPSSITTAFGALSLVHRIYAFWSNHSLHSLSIRTYGKRHAVNCTSPKPWQTLTTTTSRRSLRRRRPRTQWPTRRRRRLLVTTTMACKSTSSPLTAMPALTPPSLVST